MNLYDNIKTSIEDGRKWIPITGRALECGDNFEEMFVKVFNKYGVGRMKKVSKNVGDIPYEQTHNLDYQITYGKRGGKCWGEAKFTNTSDKNDILKKLHQVITGLFAISLNTIDRYPIWYFIYNSHITENELIDIVKDELIKNKEMLSPEDKVNPVKLLDFFKPVVFNNIWGVAPLIGGKMKLTEETEIHNLKKWFDLFLNFGNTIPKEWYDITTKEVKPDDGIKDEEKKEEKIKLNIQQETLIKCLSAFNKVKEKGKYVVKGKRSSSFNEYLDKNLQDYLDDAVSIGKKRGVLIGAGGYIKLGKKFENILIQNSIGQLQLEARNFLMERQEQPNKIIQKTII